MSTIVFTNGCFDILHAGHIQFLQACQLLGDWVVVGINSDTSVRKLKGKYRPYMSEMERVTAIRGIKGVDEVVVFPEQDACNIIKQVSPDVYAKSIEYLGSNIPEFQVVRELGGKVALLDIESEFSNLHTSVIVDRIIKRHYQERAEKIREE